MLESEKNLNSSVNLYPIPRDLKKKENSQERLETSLLECPVLQVRITMEGTLGVVGIQEGGTQVQEVLVQVDPAGMEDLDLKI